MTPQLTNGGWATSETNPWLAQFLEDLVAVCQGSNFVAQEMLPAGWYGVFSSQAFWKYDTRRLWRYVDEEEAGHRQDERLEPGSEAAQGRHPCECGKAFPTLSALALHRYRVHGHSYITQDMMVNNQCPWCKRAFTVMDNRCLQRQHMRARLRTGQCAQRNGPGGAGLTRATAPASLRCPRCDEDMPDRDQLLDHIRVHLDQEQADRMRILLNNGVPVEGRAAESIDETGGGVVQNGGGAAGCGLGEGSDRPGRANDGAGRGDIPYVLPSQGAQSGTSGRGSGRKLLRSGSGRGKEPHARPAIAMDIRSYFDVRREPHVARPREGEDPNDDTGARGGPPHVQGRSSVVHMQGTVQERGIQRADYSYAERPGMHGDDSTKHFGHGRRGENGSSPEGPSGTTPGQAAERHGSVGGTHMSSASGAGVAGLPK